MFEDWMMEEHLLTSMLTWCLAHTTRTFSQEAERLVLVPQVV
jgi:hypothetical protein